MKSLSAGIVSAILFFLLTTPANAAQLTGKVLDRDENPVIGAQIIAKNTSDSAAAGTADSDYNGTYSLFLPDGTYAITISYTVGDEKIEQTLSDETIRGTVQKDLKMEGKTNAPVPGEKGGVPFGWIAGAGGAILLFVVLLVFLKRKK